ncbi:hypothetical protein [Xanthomonas vesicatoria]|uniref:hypothetical protein n=1 Tax=Xanthomonas vesicatoria TaxID=56460 RepID=UPI0009BEC311|nr:hypothetical protein [Xanthomonas vesicatoria]MDG4489311.1 hypothetical protein [Xanthomonas vesicatoria]MDG4494805.1 hypothetical protein [Xanthomonas vesicatoria]
MHRTVRRSLQGTGSRRCSKSFVPANRRELVMIALFQGLGLLLQDNALHRRSFDEQVVYWRDKTDAELDEELDLLKVAKKQWVIASIIGWQAISLVLLGVITHQLWQDDYHLTFSRVVIIFTSWASILFIMWYIADLFDHSAGFERWLRAFNSRARVTPDADSVECVADALDMTRRYPEVLRYKQEVTSKRELRHEDIVNMREMGRLRRYTELLRDLDRFDGAPRLVANA